MLMPDLDNSCLRAFLAVLDEGGFTRAAARLNRTQSAVSMQIKRLEETLGTRLIADRKRATLTPAGERIVAHARRIVALNDEIAGRASGADITGRVRIGTPDDYAAFLLPVVLRRLALTHPQIEVEVRCDLSVHLIRAVDQGQLDLALVTRLPGLEGGLTVRREPLHWVARSEDIAERRPVPLALFSPGCPFREATEEALLKAGLSWRVAYESGSLASLLPAVSEGLAIAAIAASSVPKGLKILGVREGLPPLPSVEITVYGSRGLITLAAQTVHASVAAALSEGAAQAA